jgi:hypothetical protein
MTPNPYNEDRLVEQPALALLAELGWQRGGPGGGEPGGLSFAQGRRAGVGARPGTGRPEQGAPPLPAKMPAAIRFGNRCR